MASVDWFFKIADREIGPVPAAQLAGMAKSGHLGPDDLVRKGSQGDWVPAGRVKGLVFAAASTANPVDATADFFQSLQSSTSVPPLPVATPTSPAVRQHDATTDASSLKPSARYWILVNGLRVGPHSQAEILTKLQSGGIVGQTQVWIEGTESWMPLASIPDFAPAQPAAGSPEEAAWGFLEEAQRSVSVAPIPPTRTKNASPGSNDCSAGVSKHDSVTDAGERQDGFLEERHDFVNLAAWKSELATVGWRRLYPIGRLLKDRPWSLLWVQFLAFAFCFPLILIQYYGDKHASLQEAAWAFSLYFAVLWAAFLHRCMRPDQIKKRTLLGTWLFTSFLGVFAVLLVSALGSVLPGVREVFHASESASILGRLIGFTFAVGLVEEAAKAVPVVWFAFRRAGKTRPTTVAYVGVISGLAFGATEAIVYSLQYAAGHAASTLTYGDYLLVQVLRLVSLPLLHAIWSGVLGYFIGMAVLSKHVARTPIFIGLASVAVLHGMYNTFADAGFGFIVATLSLVLFIAYVRAESSVAVSN